MLEPAKTPPLTEPSAEAMATFVVVRVSGQAFALPAEEALAIHIVEKIEPVPQAPGDVAGLCALDGRITTVIDLRRRLGFETGNHNLPRSAVTVEAEGMLYTLLVDEIGDVLPLPERRSLPDAGEIDAAWTAFARDFYRLGGGLLLAVLDVESLVALEANGEDD